MTDEFTSIIYLNSSSILGSISKHMFTCLIFISPLFYDAINLVWLDKKRHSLFDVTLFYGSQIFVSKHSNEKEKKNSA